MTSRKLTTLILTLGILIQCKSPNDRILEEFNKVNQSIATSDSVLTASKPPYLLVQELKNNYPSSVQEIDSLYLAYTDINTYIDGLIELLRISNKTEVSTTLPTKLLINGKEGQLLCAKLLHYKQSLIALLPETISNRKIIEILQQMPDNKNYTLWLSNFFQTTPTIASITILSKIQNDCRKALPLLHEEIILNKPPVSN